MTKLPLRVSKCLSPPSAPGILGHLIGRAALQTWNEALIEH